MEEMDHLGAAKDNKLKTVKMKLQTSPDHDDLSRLKSALFSYGKTEYNISSGNHNESKKKKGKTKSKTKGK